MIFTENFELKMILLLIFLCDGMNINYFRKITIVKHFFIHILFGILFEPKLKLNIENTAIAQQLTKNVKHCTLWKVLSLQKGQVNPLNLKLY